MARGATAARLVHAVALVACAAAIGCGGGDGTAAGSSGEPEAQPVGEEAAGSVVQYADCNDWRGGTRDERIATVDALRGQLTAQSSTTAESPLDDGDAYEILTKACRPGFPGSLRLYKLYVRAQGFAPLR